MRFRCVCHEHTFLMVHELKTAEQVALLVTYMHCFCPATLQVWNIGDAVRKVQTPDKLTDSISEFQMTSDNGLAFIK